VPEGRTSATKGFKIEGSLVIRLLNVLASNIRIIDRETGKKATYQQKKEFADEFNLTEAIRIEDLQKMVEHINICNRQRYRKKHGTEPPCEYLELKVNEYIFKEILETTCPKCGMVISYYDVPQKLRCPKCGNEAVVR